MSNSIEKQIVLITGCSSGLGNQMARTLLENGAHVIATMRQVNGKNKSSASELQAFSDQHNGNLHLLEMDVSDDRSVSTAISTVISNLGRVDVVINNAGIGGAGITEAFSVEQLRLTLDVNVLGIQRVMRAVLPHMRQRKSGLIINVSSAMGRIVIPFAGAYTASKYAVEGLSESYRYELANTGVDVVIAEPGGFMTNYWSSMMTAGDAERSASYGNVSTISSSFWDGMSNTLNTVDSASPIGFAEAILEIIETPAGERPLRMVIDPVSGGAGPTAINTTSEAVQRQLLETFGFSDLLSAIPSN